MRAVSEVIFMVSVLLESLHPRKQWGFPDGSDGKEFTCNAGDLGSIPGLGRSPGERKGYPFQSSGLEKSKDCIVLGVAKSQTGLRDFQFHFHFACYTLQNY